MKKLNYYSGIKVLSFGTPFIYVLGNRSIGKSFYWTKRVLTNFRDRGEQFIYMRRYNQDLKKVAGTAFNEVLNTAPTLQDMDFTMDGKGSEGSRYYIDGRLAGITVPLSGALRYKSMSLPSVTTILFDEFIPEDNVYLPTEVGNALSFYQTIARGNGQAIRQNCRFVFLANTVTMNNPYFRELHIREKVNPMAKFTVDPDRAWVVEISNNEQIADEIASTPFGKMISKTKYGDFALKNQFYLDDDTFIQRPTGQSRYYCTLKWMSGDYGVYEYYDEGLIYISHKVDKGCNRVLALTTTDHAPNLLLLYKNRSTPIIQYFKHAFDNALVRFDNADCKYMFLEFMQYATTTIT